MACSRAGGGPFGDVEAGDAVQDPLGAFGIVGGDLQLHAHRRHVGGDRGDVLVAEKCGNAFVVEHGLGELASWAVRKVVRVTSGMRRGL